ncbi:MAG: alpha/beta hydrolase [Clostridia bacterium]|nr:alpha/beta hydrolase [Clostridia bacterium]
MSDKCKAYSVAKKAAVAAVCVAGAEYLLAELVYRNTLTRAAVNKKPYERLNDPSVQSRYVLHEDLRLSDDWYMYSNIRRLSLVSLRGETLHADMVESEAESHKWLLCIHGWTSCPRSMAIYGHAYYNKGYNIVFPYLRGHRSSEQNLVSMGLKDRYDMVDWIKYIVTMDPLAQIVIHGVSMGSATTMLVTGEDLPDNVKCAVADCGYTSVADQFSAVAKMYHIPPHPVVEIINLISIVRDGSNLFECRPVDAVKKSRTPTLFIHGMNDKFVPPAMVEKVFAACSAPKDMMLVPDAEHAESAETHPEMYWPKVWEFVDKYVHD